MTGNESQMRSDGIVGTSRWSSFPLDEIRRAWDLITGASNILILTHANPDADAVSAVLALADALGAMERTATPATGDGDLPANLEFLPGAGQLRDPATLDINAFDLLVLLDCAELHRLGPLFRRSPGWFDGRLPIVNVDHHITNSRFGTISLIDPDASATCEILAGIFLDLKLPFDVDVATCLDAGIYGDTLGLRTPSTTGRTYRIAAELFDRHADLTSIVDNLFRIKPFSTIKLWAHALSRAAVLGDIVWTEITPKMLAESGAVESEGEGIVNFIAGTKGACAGVLFYEQPESWRVSLRSIDEHVDVAALAGLYGGGGHSRAAGCTLPPGNASRDAFLRDIAARVSAMNPVSRHP